MRNQKNIFNELRDSNPEFQLLLSLIEEEFERIKEKTPISEVVDNQIPFNTEFIITPNIFHIFGQRNVLDFHPKIIDTLKSLLPYTDKTLDISFSLDFAQYGFQVCDIYNKIFENVFPYFLFWNSKWSMILLTLINEWRVSSYIKQMPLEIIIPLKGFYLSEKSSNKKNVKKSSYYNLKFISKNNIEISLKSLPSYSILRYGKGIYDEEEHFYFEGIRKDMVRYCIHAKGNIPFEINDHIEQTYHFNEVWEYIKQACISISIEGTLIRFGAPYYKFPWWFSKQIQEKFEFNYPDWINRRYMNPNAHLKLIPDIREKFEFDKTRMIGGDLSTFFEIDLIKWINKPFNPIWELRAEYFSGDDRKISDPECIEKMFIQLSDKNSNINFWNQSFILDRIIRLSQRDKIEDVILDACSILEAIFIGGTEQELSYRLKINASSLLANNISDFIEKFNYFKYLYDLRSAIIHGVDKTKKYKKKKKSKLEMFLENCYPQYLEYFNTDNQLSMYKLNRLLQYEIFYKLHKIILKILNKNIKIPDDFRETGGFLKIYTNNFENNKH